MSVLVGNISHILCVFFGLWNNTATGDDPNKNFPEQGVGGALGPNLCPQRVSV